ncbi:hypothetical protein PWG71_05900 [Nocardiopsis sp. N85]|uniref:hypothetical protein n=1 Tax=Nocardiopsis sp. N85 TaxID=3029400 RepID=UPI00237FD2F5|nr:hypothetical protein [Nocardiopsis sp. N85]MDE3720914.1 hypothetical protein [Nocardiopsis sp. N85]
MQDSVSSPATSPVRPPLDVRQTCVLMFVAAPVYGLLGYLTWSLFAADVPEGVVGDLWILLALTILAGAASAALAVPVRRGDHALWRVSQAIALCALGVALFALYISSKLAVTPLLMGALLAAVTAIMINIALWSTEVRRWCVGAPKASTAPRPAPIPVRTTTPAVEPGSSTAQVTSAAWSGASDPDTPVGPEAFVKEAASGTSADVSESSAEVTSATWGDGPESDTPVGPASSASTRTAAPDVSAEPENPAEVTSAAWSGAPDTDAPVPFVPDPKDEGTTGFVWNVDPVEDVAPSTVAVPPTTEKKPEEAGFVWNMDPVEGIDASSGTEPDDAVLAAAVVAEPTESSERDLTGGSESAASPVGIATGDAAEEDATSEATVIIDEPVMSGADGATETDAFAEKPSAADNATDLTGAPGPTEEPGPVEAPSAHAAGSAAEEAEGSPTTDTDASAEEPSENEAASADATEDTTVGSTGPAAADERSEVGASGAVETADGSLATGADGAAKATVPAGGGASTEASRTAGTAPEADAKEGAESVGAEVASAAADGPTWSDASAEKGEATAPATADDEGSATDEAAATPEPASDPDGSDGAAGAEAGKPSAKKK